MSEQGPRALRSMASSAERRRTSTRRLLVLAAALACYQRAPMEAAKAKPRIDLRHSKWGLRRCSRRARDWRTSTWGKMVQEESYKDPDTPQGKNFRRRFRMPWRVWEEACAEVKAKGWWAAGSKDATGRASAPVELLVLGVFRMLGRACTFDDLEELTDVSAETHRR